MNPLLGQRVLKQFMAAQRLQSCYELQGNVLRISPTTSPNTRNSKSEGALLDQKPERSMISLVPDCISY